MDNDAKERQGPAEAPTASRSSSATTPGAAAPPLAQPPPQHLNPRQLSPLNRPLATVSVPAGKPLSLSDSQSEELDLITSAALASSSARTPFRMRSQTVSDTGQPADDDAPAPFARTALEPLAAIRLAERAASSTDLRDLPSGSGISLDSGGASFEPPAAAGGDPIAAATAAGLLGAFDLGNNDSPFGRGGLPLGGAGLARLAPPMNGSSPLAGLVFLTPGAAGATAAVAAAAAAAAGGLRACELALHCMDCDDSKLTIPSRNRRNHSPQLNPPPGEAAAAAAARPPPPPPPAPRSPRPSPPARSTRPPGRRRRCRRGPGRTA
jgi:hypothetical protein